MADTPEEPKIVVYVMPFTAKSMTHYPASVWIPAGVPISLIDLSTGIQWLGYEGADALLAKFAGQPVESIGQQPYSIEGQTEFLTFSNLPAPFAGMTLSAHLFQAVAIKSAEKDIDTGAKDAQGAAIMAGFFDAAVPMYFGMLSGQLTPYPGT
jgi:hypothetical protein